MKHVLIAAVALVLGLVLGGVFPRAEVRRLEGEVAAMDGAECKGRIGSEIASLLTRRALSTPVLATPGVQVRDPGVGAPPEAAAEPADQAVVQDLDTGDPGVLVVDGLQEALELRRTQAWAALVEDAAPDEQQLADFDAATQSMNDGLREVLEDFLVDLEAVEMPTRRQMMVVTADMLDVLIEGEDGMRAALDQDQLEDTQDAALDPFSYISPALIDELLELGQ